LHADCHEHNVSTSPAVFKSSQHLHATTMTQRTLLVIMNATMYTSGLPCRAATYSRSMSQGPDAIRHRHSDCSSHSEQQPPPLEESTTSRKFKSGFIQPEGPQLGEASQQLRQLTQAKAPTSAPLRASVPIPGGQTQFCDLSLEQTSVCFSLLEHLQFSETILTNDYRLQLSSELSLN
jgi:hypothetical protein